MSATTTRLLVLGVVRIFEPANGYQLRRELLSWQVDRWASVRPGSIYSMLNSLAQSGLLKRHDLPNETGGKKVAVYVTTESGRAELTELIGQAIAHPNGMDPAEFRAALGFQHYLDRATFIELLGRRAAAITDQRRAITLQLASLATGVDSPPHVASTIELEDRYLATEAEWLAEFTPRVAAGEFTFLGETSTTWSPPPGDLGWHMIRQRDHYRDMLALAGPDEKNS